LRPDGALCVSGGLITDGLQSSVPGHTGSVSISAGGARPALDQYAQGPLDRPARQAAVPAPRLSNPPSGLMQTSRSKGDGTEYDATEQADAFRDELRADHRIACVIGDCRRYAASAKIRSA
jgi:hypothetical protein